MKTVLRAFGLLNRLGLGLAQNQDLGFGFDEGGEPLVCAAAAVAVVHGNGHLRLDGPQLLCPLRTTNYAERAPFR